MCCGESVSFPVGADERGVMCAGAESKLTASALPPRQMTINNLDIGRSVDETLRLVQVCLGAGR